MKLLTKITRSFLLNTALLSLISMAIIYFMTDWILKDEIDSQLKITCTEIEQKLHSGNEVSFPPFIEVQRITENRNRPAKFIDTLIYLEPEKENEPFRQLTSEVMVKGYPFRIIVRSSLIEKEDLFFTLVFIFSVIFAILVMALFFINRKRTREIFVPFNQNLQRIKKFTVKSDDGLQLLHSNVEEFEELNSSLKDLAGRVKLEYRALKEFTEDLSHELQTPVAVIKSNLELLLQQEKKDPESFNYLQSAYQNTNKLDKLNRSLILLAKLESKDFFEPKKIILREVVQKVIDNYAEIAQSMNLKLQIDLTSAESIEASETLIEILIGNLITNAIKHNIEGGILNIKLLNKTFEIENSGSTITGDPQRFFARFYRGAESPNSTGLGLAIVRKITEMYEYKINYFYKDQIHLITLVFK
jgi:signal transduction histidine kinase